jgi:hypothetical protein
MRVLDCQDGFPKPIREEIDQMPSQIKIATNQSTKIDIQRAFHPPVVHQWLPEFQNKWHIGFEWSLFRDLAGVVLLQVVNSNGIQFFFFLLK